MKSSKRRGSNGNNSGKNNYNQNQRKGSNGENSTSLAEPSNKSKKNSRSPKPLKKIPPTKPERVSSRSSSLQRIFILPRSGRSSPVTIASQKNDPRILPGDTEDQKTVDVQKFVSVPLPRTIFFTYKLPVPTPRTSLMHPKLTSLKLLRAFKDDSQLELTRKRTLLRTQSSIELTQSPKVPAKPVNLKLQEKPVPRQKRPAPQPPTNKPVNKNMLDLEKKSIDTQLRILFGQPDVLKKKSDKIKQQKLMERLVEIIELKCMEDVEE